MFCILRPLKLLSNAILDLWKAVEMRHLSVRKAREESLSHNTKHVTVTLFASHASFDEIHHVKRALLVILTPKNEKGKNVPRMKASEDCFGAEIWKA
jgi:hypothetical protein